MARQITVLTQQGVSSGTRQVKCVFWFTIAPANAQVPIPGFQSRATTVSTAEQTALENGSVREEIQDFEFPSSYTATEMKALINKRYTDRAAAIAIEPATRAFYGVTYDPTVGTNGGWSA